MCSFKTKIKVKIRQPHFFFIPSGENQTIFVINSVFFLIRKIKPLPGKKKCQHLHQAECQNLYVILQLLQTIKIQNLLRLFNNHHHNLLLLHLQQDFSASLLSITPPVSTPASPWRSSFPSQSQCSSSSGPCKASAPSTTAIRQPGPPPPQLPSRRQTTPSSSSTKNPPTNRPARKSAARCSTC